MEEQPVNKRKEIRDNIMVVCTIVGTIIGIIAYFGNSSKENSKSQPEPSQIHDSNIPPNGKEYKTPAIAASPDNSLAVKTGSLLKENNSGIKVKILAIDNALITLNMMRGTMEMINEINTAFNNNTLPNNPNESLIDNNAYKNILSLWAGSHFKVATTELNLNGLHLQDGGYQTRNIPIYFEAQPDKNQDHEIAFTFDKSGKMIDCFLCLEMNTYQSLLRNHNSVTDQGRREIILDFIEKFQTAYNTKNTVFINQVFSDNALIIVGKVIKESQTPMDGIFGTIIPTEKIKYMSLSKKEYLQKLSKVFKANEFIKIDFDSIEIVKHQNIPEIYGITLWQSWRSTNYSDQGWLFLMIDFMNESQPMIRVRTWQPSYLNGQVLAKNNVFQLSEFNIER